MAKRKSSLAQQVAELKSTLALLVDQLAPKQEIEYTPVPTPKKGKGRKSKQVDNNEGRGIRAGSSSKIKTKSKTFAHMESVNVGKRVNLFDKMMEKNLHKDDTKIDKKLWKGKSPSPRCGRSTLIDVRCNECDNEFSVSPNELKIHEDENGHRSSIYVCNDCIRR